LFIKSPTAELKHVLFKLTEEEFLDKIGKRFELKRPAADKLIGVVQILNEGDFGFVKLTNTNINDVFVAGKNLSTAFNGDTVEVKLFEKKTGKNIEAAIVKIISRGFKEIVGTLNKSKSFYFVLPDDKKIHRDIYISAKDIKNAKPGDKVIVSNIDASGLIPFLISTEIQQRNLAQHCYKQISVTKTSGELFHLHHIRHSDLD